MIQVENFQEDNLRQYTLHSREYTVDVDMRNNKLTLIWKYDGELEGKAIFDRDGMTALRDGLATFYKPNPKRNNRVTFDSDSADVTIDEATKSILSRTNWGDPFDEGVHFYLPEGVSFALVESDASTLLYDLKEATA